MGTGSRETRLMIVGWERRTARITGERAELVIKGGKVRFEVPNW